LERWSTYMVESDEAAVGYPEYRWSIEWWGVNCVKGSNTAPKLEIGQSDVKENSYRSRESFLSSIMQKDAQKGRNSLINLSLINLSLLIPSSWVSHNNLSIVKFSRSRWRHSIIRTRATRTRPQTRRLSKTSIPPLRILTRPNPFRTRHFLPSTKTHPNPIREKSRLRTTIGT
jgi:hypothetical protein